MPRLIHLVLAVLVLPTVFPEVAQAQLKRRTKDSVIEEQTKSNLEKANEDWIAAMETLDDPYLFVIFGIDDGTPSRSLGLNLTPDEQTNTERFASEIRSFMTRAYPDTEIIDIDELGAKQKRDAADLADTGLEAAIDQVLREINCDLAILFEFTPRGSGYSVIGKIVDPRNPRRFDTGAHSLSLNDEVFERNASLLFIEIAELMRIISERKAPKYNVRLIGDLGAVRITEVARKIPDLEYVTTKRGPRPTGPSGNQRLEGIRYDGYALDLGYDLVDLLIEEFGLRADVAFGDGDVTLTVRENTEPPGWYALTDPDSDRAEIFGDLYTERGGSKIAVLVNEIREEAFALDGNFDQGVNEALGSERRISSVLSPQAEALETELAGILQDAGVDVLNGSEIRQMIATNMLVDEGRARDGMIREATIEQALRKAGNIDALFVAQLSAEDVSQGFEDLKVSGRVTLIESARVLGARSWPSRDATSDPDYSVEGTEARDVARFLGGSVLDMYLRNHLQRGSFIDVTVDGVASYRQLMHIADSLEIAVPGVRSVTGRNYDNGRGSYTVRFDGDVNDLQNAIQDAIAQLDIEQIVDEASSGKLVLRARPLPTGE